jgi:hypothetical protein
MDDVIKDKLDYLQSQVWDLENKLNDLRFETEKMLNLKIDEIISLLKMRNVGEIPE